MKLQFLSNITCYELIWNYLMLFPRSVVEPMCPRGHRGARQPSKEATHRIILYAVTTMPASLPDPLRAQSLRQIGLEEQYLFAVPQIMLSGRRLACINNTALFMERKQSLDLGVRGNLDNAGANRL